MYGAILGDIIGSPFEFDRGDKTKDFQLFTEGCYYTDDTVMTIAVGEALIAVGPTATIEEIEDAVIANMKDWGKRYPNAGYGGSFRRWLKSKSPKPYGSYGNGSAMRVSAAGWLYDTLDRTREVARATANVTHNHPEGIKGAEATASAIFFARKGISKEDIKEYIENEFGYDLNRSLDEIRPGFSMDESCQGTVPEAIIAFLEGNDFEDTVRNAVSLGGDTDTLAAIAGSIAEAYYGIPSSLISECRNRLEDKFMIRVLDEFDYILGRKKDTDIEEELKRNIVIENAIENLYKSGNGDSITEVFDIIIDRMHEDGEVLVPYIMNDDLMLDKIAENLKVGNTFTLDHEVRLKLETVTDKEGKEWYAAFTSLLEIEKGTIGNVRMNISLENAFRWTIESNLEGIVINPFGKHVTINKDLAKEILSYYEQEKAEYQSSDEEERQEMISEIKMYCDELDMDYPDGFPDGMSNQEMREWIANWSEFDPFPELNQVTYNRKKEMSMYDKRKAADYIELIEESQENYRKNPEKYRDKNIELLPPDVNESMANGAVGEVDLLEKVCSFCKEINLYTYWQGFGYAKSTPEIKYLLVAQDFGNPFNAQNKIIKNILKMNAGELNTQYLDNADKDAWITDKNLIRLFEVLGYKGADGIDKKRHSELFFTNFSLGYRAGKESGSMTVKMMMEDSKYFKRLCDILEPKYILCLGKLTFQCVYETLKGDPIRNLEIANYNEYISKHPEIIYENDKYTCQIFPLAHCGSMGTMNRNKIEGSNSNKLTSDGTTKKDPLEKQIEDWQWVKNASR